MSLTVGDLRRAILELSDDAPVTLYAPGDPSVGIFEAYMDGRSAGPWVDYDDETGRPIYLDRLLITIAA